MRVKLIILLALTTMVVALTALVTVNKAGRDLEDTARNALLSAKEVIRLENRIGDYSLLATANELSLDDAVVRGMLCPATDEELRDANREQTPAINPETGQPVVDELGRPVDTNGLPIVERTGPRCQSTQHQAVYEALRAWNAEQEEARAENIVRDLSARDIGHALPADAGPSLLMVADAEGVVVARIGYDMQDWYGPSRPNLSQFPVVGRTHDYGYQHDIIAWSDHESEAPRMAHVASAPVHDAEGNFLGSVLIGEYMTNDWANDDLLPLYDVDLAYVMNTNDRLHFQGTSMASAFQSALSDAEYYELRPDGGVAESSVALDAVVRDGQGGIYRFEHNGERFLLTSGAYARTRADTSNYVGFVVVASVDRFVAPLNVIRQFTPIMAALAIFLGILGILFIFNQFVAPIEEISRGIQEVIAGNKDYMWPVDERSHLSDMSHSLNIMSARLQGKRDPDSEDLDGQSEWAGMVGGGGQQGGGAKKPGQIGGLGNLRGRRAKKQDDETPDA